MNKLVILVILLSIISCKEKPTKIISKEIHTNWSFKSLDGTHSGTATVPGTIHTDLLENHLIEDPFYRVNEKKQQWIDKKDWEYTTTFNVLPNVYEKQHVLLNFKGLDTYADVYLNDSLILQANNMFRSWEVNIKPLIRLGDNSLKVLLHSPIKKGLELLEASTHGYPANMDQSENGEIGDKKVSMFTRKAGYHYGWDWGPRLVTSGIWRPIILKAWNTIRVTDIFIKQPSITKAEAKIEFDVTVAIDKPFLGQINILNSETKAVYKSIPIELNPEQNIASIPLSIKNPKLWWTKGLGEPNMYNFTVQVLDEDDNEVSRKDIASGLRSIKLIRDKDEVGESFLFELNGVPTFIKGANYIPNDSFLTRVTKEDYKKVVEDAVNANMNMLRVWGGGIYEDDYFYELCDKNGVMVWQDFMFACAMYPGDEAFLENIKQEAIDNVIRLRNHPSIALWCGNNEISWAWSFTDNPGWGWKKLYTEAQQESIGKTYLDIFHDILPEVVTTYSNGTDYWPSSPQAGFEPEKYPSYKNTSGDMHYWGVWHGQHPFEEFENYKARFMSEYGFQSFPDFETVKKYTIPEDYDIESEVMASHQRSGIGNLRIKEYMGWDYNVPSKFEDFLYMSQVLQAQGIKTAIEAHRRAMPYCMGTMYWQINDCWPVASWSSTDYYKKWKALHYAVKKAYEPILLTIHKEGEDLVIHGVSDKLKALKGELKLSILDFSGKELHIEKHAVVLNKNTSTELLRKQTYLISKGFNKKDMVLKVEFYKNNEKPLAKNLFYLEKPKNLNLEKPTIQTAINTKDGKTYLKLSSDRLVKNLYINFKNQEVFISDNYFDVLPNEEIVLGLTSKENIDLNTIEFQYVL
ncbi:glycoside hydrolase family 2 protein [Algibacter sp. AS12]|uniref:beta-mannosidase n=1 Tax=Algibacter sp. AS12 TaxID=3135773 RepID=UPI00398AFF1E